VMENADLVIENTDSIDVFRDQVRAVLEAGADGAAARPPVEDEQ